jgi:hypothetical protein
MCGSTSAMARGNRSSRDLHGHWLSCSALQGHFFSAPHFPFGRALAKQPQVSHMGGLDGVCWSSHTCVSLLYVVTMRV